MNDMTSREHSIDFLPEKGLLTHGCTQFIIKGSFGETELLNEYEKTYKERALKDILSNFDCGPLSQDQAINEIFILFK